VQDKNSADTANGGGLGVYAAVKTDCAVLFVILKPS